MPEFNSDIYNNQVGTAGQSPAFGRDGAKVTAGKMRMALIPYVCDGAEVADDTINLVRLKWGARVVPSYCKVSSEAAFDCHDVNIGNATDASAYGDAVDTLNAISDVNFSGGTNHYAPADEAENKDGTTVIATLIGVTTTTAGQLTLWTIVFLDE